MVPSRSNSITACDRPSASASALSAEFLRNWNTESLISDRGEIVRLSTKRFRASLRTFHAWLKECVNVVLRNMTDNVAGITQTFKDTSANPPAARAGRARD